MSRRSLSSSTRAGLRLHSWTSRRMARTNIHREIHPWLLKLSSGSFLISLFSFMVLKALLQSIGCTTDGCWLTHGWRLSWWRETDIQTDKGRKEHKYRSFFISLFLWVVLSIEQGSVCFARWHVHFFVRFFVKHTGLVASSLYPCMFVCRSSPEEYASRRYLFK